MRFLHVLCFSLMSVCAALSAQAQPRFEVRPDLIPNRPIAIISADLDLIFGSGEFVQLRKDLSVTLPEALRFEWGVRVEGAVSARWEVTRTDTSAVVASGTLSPVPDQGGKRSFTLASNTFLLPSQPPNNVVFEIRLWPLNSSGTKIGGGAVPVKITQLSPDNTAPPTDFGDGARFPQVTLSDRQETIGQLRLTQLQQAHLDLTLRVENTGSELTDPVFLKVLDQSLLYRQQQVVEIPALKPGDVTTRQLRLMAILPPAQSQLPARQQMRTWRARHGQMCGAELRVQLDWKGPASQTPISPTRITPLVPAAWQDVALIPPNRRQCSGGQCTTSCTVEKELRKLAQGRVEGYGFALGQHPHTGGGGLARRDADGKLAFTGETKMTTASVSKWITALGAMAVLADNGMDIFDQIGPFFPPDWDVDPYFQGLTFDDLLGQRSGIMDYGNIKQDFATLQAFMEQAVDPAWTTGCQPATVVNPPNPVNMSQMVCYSNYNTGLMRILLPRVAGRVTGNAQPATYDQAYEDLVNEFVFAPIGATGTGCRPPGTGDHAFGYNLGETGSGVDWGDVRDECGAAGWYVSPADMAAALTSVLQRDGRILREDIATPMAPQMQMRALGIDNSSVFWMEKNGGWGGCDDDGCGQIGSSAAIFLGGTGDGAGPAMVGVLFINSDVADDGGPASARGILQQAYRNALTPQ